MAKDTGRCINCGFLGKRSLGEQVPTVIEVTSKEREQADPQLVAGRSCRMVCYRNKTQFTFEYPSHDPEKLKLELQEARDCQFWYFYEEGRPPEKRYEELRMLELELGREEFEQNMEERRKEFELRMEKDRKDFDLKLQANSDRITERADRFNRRVTWFFVVLAILEVVGTFLSLAFPNGMKWLTDLFG